MTNTFDMRLKAGVSENDAAYANFETIDSVQLKSLPSFIHLFLEFIISSTGNTPEVNSYG
jgi:hypothetical protein